MTKITKNTFRSFFSGKTVTLMGLGLLGRGVGDAAFLAEHCKKLYVTDMKSADELRVSVEALKNFKNIEFFLGGHGKKIFTETDFVIKGAGVRLDNPYIVTSRAHNIPVYMSTALFAYLSGIPIIGVTGTRGKTTVTCMIADILKRAGRNILVGGNIRGMSTLAQLENADDYEMAVLELDSWQMQGFDDLGISPHIGVFTSFYPDHMNYYDGNMDLYLHDKAAIFRHQKKDDILVTTQETADLLNQKYTPSSRWIIASPLLASFPLGVPGAHNFMNAGLAQAVAQQCGVDQALIDTALCHFKAVEGRLQLAHLWQGRTFYNDSNATTQEATMAALTAFAPETIILIFGGADKGLPIDHMVNYIRTQEIRCILLAGTGSDRVRESLPELTQVHSMHDAIQQAIALSKAGDNIILSPAFASFGLFKNEYDRSDQFMHEIGMLKEDA